MKYNLAEYDKVIQDLLAAFSNKTEVPIIQTQLNDVLKRENIKIRREIRETVFTLKSNSRIELYIHKQQMALENLISLIICEINPKHRKDLYTVSNPNSLEDQLKFVYKKLEKLQIFLENDYAKYLCSDTIVPFRSFVKMRKVNIAKIESIRRSKPTAELSLALLEIICLQNNLRYGRGITYHKFNYNNKFISELSLFLDNEKGMIYDDTIILFLLEINYNSKSFFKFLVRKISEELDGMITIKEKIDYLLHLIKTYNQIDTFDKSAYNKKRIHICKQIINWLEEEIKYLSLNHLPNSSIQNSINESLEKTNKIKVGISVAQLSCILNLFCETDILKPKNRSDLFRFAANNFETSKAENISANSINAKFYNIESGTKESVKSLMIKILNILKK